MLSLTQSVRRGIWGGGKQHPCRAQEMGLLWMSLAASGLTFLQIAAWSLEPAEQPKQSPVPTGDFL